MGAIERIGHSIAVASSLLTFILLAILFIGPNSPFLSPSLCFLKMNLSHYTEENATFISRPNYVRILPETNQLTPAVKILQQGQTLENIQMSYTVAQTKIDNTHTSSTGLLAQRSPTHDFGEHYNALRDRSSPFRTYLVGLLNICHITKYPDNDKECSKSSIISSMPSILCQKLAEEGLDREICDKGMKHTYSVLSRLSIWAYLSGALMIFLALAIGIRLVIYCKGSTLAVFSTLLGFLSISLAVACSTLEYIGLMATINSLYPTDQIETTLSGLFLVSWSAVGVSIATLITWLIVFCCCCI